MPRRTKWRHILQRFENGLERCVGCMLCAGACPTDAIYIEAEEVDPENPVSPGERYARIYEIDYGRCIMCGFCVEACPTEALEMTEIYELSAFTREDIIKKKQDLLVPPKTAARKPWLGYYRRGDPRGLAVVKPYHGPFAIPREKSGR